MEAMREFPSAVVGGTRVAWRESVNLHPSFHQILGVLAAMIAAPAIAQPPVADPDPVAPEPDAPDPAPEETDTASEPVGTSTPRAEPEPVESAPEPEPEPEPEEEDELSFSGFIQAQFVHNLSSGEGVDSAGRPQNTTLFEVRRARLKLNYDGDHVAAVLHVDALPSGFRLLEAEASVTIPWSDEIETDVTAGLFRIPFGWELQESMRKHPFPERSTWANRLFPGVRDVGLRVQGTLFDEQVRYQVALQNGNPIGDALFPALDPNGFKDVVARAGVDFDVIEAGVSGLVGEGYLPPAEDDPATMNVDETHGPIDYSRFAIGVDAVARFDVPVLGELQLLGEAVFARNLDRRRVADLPPVHLDPGGPGQVATEAVDDRDVFGFYVGLQQHLGDYFALGARLDWFDRDLSADGDALTAIAIVAHAYPLDPLRFTLAYEIRIEEPQVDDDQLWARMQIAY
jgi:hypothetical protein